MEADTLKAMLDTIYHDLSSIRSNLYWHRDVETLSELRDKLGDLTVWIEQKMDL